MGHKSIGYHTRLRDNVTVKVCGGGFGGSFDMETANRLVKQHFTVKAKPSGTLVFVDREGREVSLYVSVDPETTEAGKLVRKEYNKQKAAAILAASTCEHKQDGSTCSTLFNCCDCGNSGGNGCGCRYCWSCNACEACLTEANS